MEVLIAAAIGVAVILAVWLYTSARLNNPNDKSFLRVDELAAEICLAQDFEYQIDIFRQSGSQIRSYRGVAGGGEAVEHVLDTLRRAKIDAVVIVQNQSDCLEIRRAFWGHKGTREGRKVGSICAQAIDDLVPIKVSGDGGKTIEQCIRKASIDTQFEQARRRLAKRWLASENSDRIWVLKDDLPELLRTLDDVLFAKIRLDKENRETLAASSERRTNLSASLPEDTDVRIYEILSENEFVSAQETISALCENHGIEPIDFIGVCR